MYHLNIFSIIFILIFISHFKSNYRRLELLENPAAPPITVYKQDPKIASLRTGLSPADQQLVDRLEKLKDKGRAPPPSEVELRKRLATLKGENDYVEGPSRTVSKSVLCIIYCHAFNFNNFQ